MKRVDITVRLKEKTFSKDIHTGSKCKGSICVSIKLERKLGEVVLAHIVTCPHVGENERSTTPKLYLAKDSSAAIGQSEPLGTEPCVVVFLSESLNWIDFLSSVVSLHIVGFRFGDWSFRLFIVGELEIFALELHLFKKFV